MDDGCTSAEIEIHCGFASQRILSKSFGNSVFEVRADFIKYDLEFMLIDLTVPLPSFSSTSLSSISTVCHTTQG